MPDSWGRALGLGKVMARLARALDCSAPAILAHREDARRNRRATNRIQIVLEVSVTQVTL